MGNKPSNPQESSKVETKRTSKARIPSNISMDPKDEVPKHESVLRDTNQEDQEEKEVQLRRHQEMVNHFQEQYIRKMH